MTNVEPVHVHLASVSDGVSLAAPRPRPRKFRPVVTTTIQLTASNPYQLVCARDSSRLQVILQAIGGAFNDAAVAHNKADAAQIASGGAAEGLGAVLRASNTTPTVINTTDELYVATLLAPSQVSVILVSETTAED